MKAKEVHKLSEEEISIQVNRLRKPLFDLRTQAVTEKIENTTQFAKVRKDLARQLTEKNVRGQHTDHSAHKQR